MRESTITSIHRTKKQVNRINETGEFYLRIQTDIFTTLRLMSLWLKQLGTHGFYSSSSFIAALEEDTR